MALNIIIAAQDKASGIIAGIGTSLSGLVGGGALGSIAVAAAAAGVGLVKMAMDATSAAGDFQQGLTQLVNTAGESGNNIGMLGEGIKQMAIDTGTSTKQLIDGAYMVESAGFHGRDALLVMTAAAQGAKAENANLGVVAKSLTTLMHDYGMGAGQATNAMNGMIATVASGKVRLQEMSAAMGTVLPIASALGVSFPQIGGAMAAMTNAGVSAQRAAQNLGFALRALSAPSGVGEKAMKSVGLTAQQVKDTLGQKGLAATLQLIEDHVGKQFPKNSTQYTTAMKAIMGGAAGLNVMLMLGGKNMTTYEKDISTISAAMQKGGSSIEGWSRIQQNWNFQMDRAKEQAEVFMISLGQKLIPILTQAMQWFTNLLAAITPFINGTGNAADAVKLLGGAVGWLVAFVGQAYSVIFNDEPIGLFLGGLKSLAQTIGGVLMAALHGLSDFVGQVLTASFGTPRQAAMVLAGVMSDIGYYAGMLSNAIRAAQPTFIQIGDVFKSIGMQAIALATNLYTFFTATQTGSTIIKAALAIAAGSIVAFLASTIPELIAGFFAWVAAAGAAAIATIAAAAPFILAGAAIAAVAAGIIYAYQHFKVFRDFVAAAGQAIATFWHGVTQLASVIGQFLAPIFALIVNDMKKELIPVFQQVVKDIQGSLLPAWKSMQPALAEIWKALQTLAPVLKIVGALILAAFVMALVILASVLVGVVKGLAGLISGLAIVLSGIMDFFSGTMKVVSGALNFLHDLFTGNFKKLGSDLGEIWSGVGLQFKGIWEIISGIFLTALNGITGFFGGFMDTIIKIWTDLASELVGHSIIPDMVNAIIAWFTKIPGFIISLMTTVTRNIVVAWTNIYNAVKSALVNVYNAIVAGFQSVVKAVTTAWQNISTIFSNAWNTYIARPLAALTAYFTTWATAQIANFTKWATNMMSGFGAAITRAQNLVLTPLTNVGTAITNILGFHSPPPTGPLAQSNTWMPNMMTMFGQGVSANTTKVTAPVNNMGVQVANSMTNMSNNVNNQSRLINLNLSTIGTQAQQTNQKTTQQMGQMNQSVQNTASGIKQSTNTINSSIQGVNTQVQSINQVAPAAFQNVNTSAKAMAQGVDQSGMQVIKTTTGIQQSTQQMGQKVVGDFNNMDRAVQGSAKNASTAAAVFTAASDVATKGGRDVQKAGTVYVTVGGSAKDAADKFATAGKDMKKSADETDKAVKALLVGDLGKAVDNFSKELADKFKALVAQAQGVASQIAALLGHSKPSVGPLMDDDKWGTHFMENIIGGMQSSLPALQKTTGGIASTIASGLGGSLASGGDIALKLPNSSSLQNQQHMTIYMQVDGKTVGKVATKYMERELRVQGNIRNG